MKQQQANVSVVSANYNNGKYLKQFIDSIMNSSVLPKEIIVVDDGSTDDSAAILKKLSEETDILKPVLMQQNQGFANALNIGLKEVTGAYVLRLDPDDYVHPERIRLQYELLEGNKELDVVGSNAAYFDSDTGKVIFKSNFPASFEEIKKRYHTAMHGVLHGTVMGKTALFIKYGYQQQYVPAEDYAIFARMIAEGAVMQNLPEPLTYVRVHAGSVSNDLNYKAISEPYIICNELFHTNYGKLKTRLTFYHLKFYRRFLFQKNLLKRMWYLLLAVSLNPAKIAARIKR
ncbi:glycosyltransferase involved in cell wall biosynthesis [Chitinophaga niastensis]|uniref:Glycosyltransferase involved in cell wall biosynthesis n=1 Tax=Chitinophaga niastensis TaxID=536980 RepID=A0A2P8HRU6_CHINA|nr:glycosyltransferase [Chitinophaga niastensis]PSL48937.1 glycosyltransferase involved in cell wall biosynthesis [Chitinophaga niastensis]